VKAYKHGEGLCLIRRDTLQSTDGGFREPQISAVWIGQIAARRIPLFAIDLERTISNLRVGLEVRKVTLGGIGGGASAITLHDIRRFVSDSSDVGGQRCSHLSGP
jgi:hypothetical protein